MPRRIRTALVNLGAVLGAGAGGLVGTAPASSTGSPTSTNGASQVSTGQLKVGVEVLQFAASGRKLSATGQVTATLTDNHGTRTTVRTRVA